MDFEMVGHINFKKLMKTLESEDNFEINHQIEKKLKKAFKHHCKNEKNLFVKENTDLNKDEYLSFFCSMSKINFVKLDALIDNFNFDIFKITKDIIVTKDSKFERTIEKDFEANTSKLNPLDSYLNTMFDMFAFKYILSKLRNMTLSLKDQIENYLGKLQSEKENYSQYSKLLFEKLKKVFDLDDFFKFKKFNHGRRLCEDNVEKSIEYLEQSPFSVEQLWLTDDKQTDEWNFELNKENDNFTKSTNTNSRRFSKGNNNYNSGFESKSSKHLFKSSDLMELKEINKLNINQNENLYEMRTYYMPEKKEYKKCGDNFTTFRDKFLSKTASKHQTTISKRIQFSDENLFTKKDNCIVIQPTHIQKYSLGVIAELSNCHLINTQQRSRLKELIIDNNKALINILNIYDSERDLNLLYKNILRLLSNIKN